MKANELRIGNFVQRKKQVLKVLNVQWDKSLLKGYPAGNRYFKLNEIEPIKLTEDWFLNLGFKRITTNEYWFVIPLKDRSLNVSVVGNVEIKSWDMLCISLGCICEYVHELQNLYFALTGEEIPFLNS